MSVLCISMFRFLSFFFQFLALLLFSKTQKDQKYFCCFSLFTCFLLVSSFSLLGFYLSCNSKIQKHFALLLVSFVLVLKFENPKIFVVLLLLLFCKVCCRVQQPSVTPLELGYHFILSKPRVKSNYDDLWQFELG